MTITTQPHSLSWGDILLDAPVSTADNTWLVETMATGASFGNPEPLVETVRRWVDGETKLVTGHGNRTATFRVRLSAPDGVALALAEAAFMAEVSSEQHSPLVWTSPILDSWTAVFDVVHANLDGDYADGWDFEEVSRSYRYYLLTLECLPWARDPETVVIPALPQPEEPDEPVTVTVDTCDSLTGWSAPTPIPNGYWPSGTALSNPSGAVRVAGPITWSSTSTQKCFMFAKRTGAIPTATGGTPWLVVHINGREGLITGQTGDPVGDWSAAINGGGHVYPDFTLPMIDGTRKLYFYAPVDVTSFQLRTGWNRVTTKIVGGVSYSRNVAMNIYQIDRADRLPSVDTGGLQVARTAQVGGTAPTQARIRFGNGTETLLNATALVYTGGSPVVSLDQHIVASAARTISATAVSGYVNNFTTNLVIRVPISALSRAKYALIARLYSGPTSKTINWSAQVTAADGSPVPGSEVVVSGSAQTRVSPDEPWRLETLAAIPMPIIATEGATTHCVQITLSMSAEQTLVAWDEGWLCDVDNGAVTYINEASAFELAQIEVRSPELDAPRPAVIGTWLTHGTQDIGRLATLGTHRFEPGTLNVFTMCDQQKFAPCELEYYRRYHTHPGPDLGSDE